MKADLDDTNFMDGMKTLLGLDDDKVEKLLDELDSDSLVALADAVAKQDKTAVEAIIGSFENQLSSLFGKQLKAKKEKSKKKPVKPPKNYEFAIGDDVAIKTKGKHDKDKFVSATVYKPKAPGNTVGVKIDGKSQIVDKDSVFMLKEMVIGMTGMTNMPDLARMQQLAGIQTPPQVSAEVAQEPQDHPMTYDQDDSGDDVSKALCALDTLENVLPNIRLADVKAIRQRMTEITAKMNESLSPGRAQKL